MLLDDIDWPLLIAVVAIVAALLAPGIAWKLTRQSQIADQRRQTKINIFGAIMENRHSFHSRELIRGLNLIDVAFHDDPDVRRHWREYHGMINSPAFFNSAVGDELRRQKLAELETAMARVLGFDIDRFDVERIYAPQWLRDEEEVEMRDRQVRLSAFRSQTPPPPAANAASSPSTNSAVYNVRYVGTQGAQGDGIFFIGNGAITGSDIAGGRYDGTYSIVNDRLIGTVTLSVPAGTTLVTGLTTTAPSSLPITIDLPLDFANAQPQTLTVGGQPVQVVFQKVRDV